AKWRFRGDGGPFGNSRTCGPDEGWRRGGAGKTYRDQEVCGSTEYSGCGAVEDGEAGRGDRRLDERNGSDHQRDPVLDGAGRIFWRSALHGDEHDEQRRLIERVRGGYRRSGGNACAATGVGNAKRAARLE